jgi:hypothetical protein
MPFTFNPQARRYEQDGATVSDKQIREWMFSFTDKYSATVRSLTQDLVDGKLNLPAWQISMSEAIKASRLDAAMAAAGGKEMMTNSLYGRVGVEIREELKYLKNFALDIANEKISLDGRAVARSEMYIEGATNYYENQVTERERAAGVTMAQRFLEEGSEHCDDCLNAANDEPVAIDEIIAIGDSSCGARCNCYVEYSSDEGEGE